MPAQLEAHHQSDGPTLFLLVCSLIVGFIGCGMLLGGEDEVGVRLTGAGILAIAVYLFARLRNYGVGVLSDGVVVFGMFSTRTIPWTEIARFDTCRGTNVVRPTVVLQIVFTSGKTRRVESVVSGLFSPQGVQDVVDDLNRRLEQSRQSEPSDRESERSADDSA